MKKLFFTTITTAFLTASVLSGCSDSENNLINNSKPLPEENSVRDIYLTRTLMEVRDVSNQFAYRFFEEVANRHADSSGVCVSPLSISMLLSMMANGDDGEVRDDIVSVLTGNSSSFNIEDLNAYNSMMLQALPEIDSSAIFSAANSIWLNNGLSFISDFQCTMQECYNADVNIVNLATSEAMWQMNTWVNDNTNGLIPRLLEHPLSPSAKLALMNTIYFKGKWGVPFDSDLTFVGDFSNVSKDVSQTTMMRLPSTPALYGEHGGAQMAVLPYGNGRYEMLAILPPDEMPVAEFVTHLESNVQSLDKATNVVSLSMTMPKFSAESRFDIDEVLTSIGLESAYSKGFNSIAEGSCLNMSSVFQRTVLSIDEEGAEGAAASVGILDVSSGAEIKEVSIDFNRPFFYIIREKKSDAVIFIGSMLGV